MCSYIYMIAKRSISTTDFQTYRVYSDGGSYFCCIQIPFPQSVSISQLWGVVAVPNRVVPPLERGSLKIWGSTLWWLNNTETLVEFNRRKARRLDVPWCVLSPAWECPTYQWQKNSLFLITVSTTLTWFHLINTKKFVWLKHN